MAFRGTPKKDGPKPVLSPETSLVKRKERSQEERKVMIKAQELWFSGEYTLKQIGTVLGLEPAMVREYSEEMNWPSKRDVQKEINERTADIVTAARNREFERVYNQELEQIEREIEQVTEFIEEYRKDGQIVAFDKEGTPRYAKQMAHYKQMVEVREKLWARRERLLGLTEIMQHSGKVIDEQGNKTKGVQLNVLVNLGGRRPTKSENNFIKSVQQEQ